MAVVTESCIKCKHTDCVEVCPVDAFYEGENMLVINTDECICCEVCIPECPEEAIVSEWAPNVDAWLEHNRKFSAVWPNITVRKTPPEDADAYKAKRASSRNTFPRSRAKAIEGRAETAWREWLMQG